MNTLEQQLNNAIEKHGFRISPRASLRERLARYIELHKGVDATEAEAAAGLMLLRHNNNGLVSGQRQVRVSENNNIRVSISVATPQSQPHSSGYSLRQRTPTQNSTTQSNGNHSTSQTNGSHTMIRRSQSSAK